MPKYYPSVLVATVLCLGVGWAAWKQIDWISVDGKGKLTSLDSQPWNESESAALPVEVISDPLTSVVRIPFTLTESNNISIPVVINGKDSLNLMFHTAVDSISLTAEAVEKMQTLDTSGSVDVKSWGGTGKSAVSTGNRLQIGELEWSEQTIFVNELSGPGTDGKFGPHLFAHKILEINFDNRELVLHAAVPKAATDATSKYQRLDISQKRDSMYVDGELTVGDSKYTNPLMIHSGFGGTVLLDDSFVATHKIASKLETISERELKDSFGNILKTKRVKLSSLTIGGIRFFDIPIEIFDGAIGNQKVSVLGGDLLKTLNLLIDAEHHPIYISPSTRQ
ncbi:MAG: hypothetical protein ABL921_13475 [Pirellula sp.]